MLNKIRKVVLSPALLLNIVAPVITYQVLSRLGVALIPALTASAVFPLAAVATGVARTRRLDALALLSLIAIVVGIVLAWVLHDGRVLLVKDSIVTGVLGIVFAASLAAPQPMIFTLRRRMAGHGREAVEHYDRSWADPSVRRTARRMTALWAVALVVEAATRIGLSTVVSPGALLVLSPFLALVVFGPLALLTYRTSRRDPERRA